VAIAPARTEHVLVVSVDGLNASVVTAEQTPALTRMIREGAATRNARTEAERTETLPNHTGMVTSRRIDRRSGGHGVWWNDERLAPRTVQEAAGGWVGSVFSALESRGLSAAVFASKQKFTLFDRSWPAGVDRMVVQPDNHALTTAAIDDLLAGERAFTFLHLSGPDVAGHASGFLSPAYLRAVRAADDEIARVRRALESRPDLLATTTVVVTADHGGRGPSHTDPTRLANYRIPFVAWGAQVAAGRNLYALNPDYADPGTARVWYSARRQPVRNGDVANLALDLLGLPAVRGSGLNAAQDLDVR